MKTTACRVAVLAIMVFVSACSRAQSTAGTANSAPTAGPAPAATYLDYSGRDDELTGDVKMVPITTPKGMFRVWTKRVGNNPRIKVLLLHGGPGANHEYLEAFDSYFPKEGIEYYYYDQLGSSYSDQPKDPSLWELPRFIEEVEQVRQALGLTKDTYFAGLVRFIRDVDAGKM